jgi:hypothetical protein
MTGRNAIVNEGTEDRQTDRLLGLLLSNDFLAFTVMMTRRRVESFRTRLPGESAIEQRDRVDHVLCCLGDLTVSTVSRGFHNQKASKIGSSGLAKP